MKLRSSIFQIFNETLSTFIRLWDFIFSILFIENSAVTAYLSAIPFFEKNDFKMLLGNDENKHTRTMYFDMLEL